MNEEYTGFWIPFLLVYIPVFFFLRPLFKTIKFKSNINKEGFLWVLFPFSISIPTAFSQSYFRNISYEIVTINYPSEVHLFPNERFFNIKNFNVNKNDFILYKESHISGGRSKSLKLNYYYIAPLFDNNERLSTTVAYGIKYSTSLNHGLLFRKEQPKKIWEFDIKSGSAFTSHYLDSGIYFEKQVKSDDATNFATAWKSNKLTNNDQVPTVLVPSQTPIDHLFIKGRRMTFYSLIASLAISLSLLFIFRQKEN